MCVCASERERKRERAVFHVIGCWQLPHSERSTAGVWVLSPDTILNWLQKFILCSLCLTRIWHCVLNLESHSCPWRDVLHPDASAHLCEDTGNSSLCWRKSSFVVSANSLLSRIYQPRWCDDVLWSPWTHRGVTRCIAHHDIQCAR